MEQRPETTHQQRMDQDRTSLVTRGTLDAAVRQVCQDQGDDGTPPSLAIRPKCHPDAGSEVLYQRGALVLLCHGCHMPVMVIAVQGG
jgi:hypothetical protein